MCLLSCRQLRVGLERLCRRSVQLLGFVRYLYPILYELHPGPTHVQWCELQGTPSSTAIFIAPLFFGAAHMHHLHELVTHQHMVFSRACIQVYTLDSHVSILEHVIRHIHVWCQSVNISHSSQDSSEMLTKSEFPLA